MNAKALWEWLGHFGKIRSLVFLGGLLVASLLWIWGYLTSIPGPVAALIAIWAIVGLLLIARLSNTVRIPKFSGILQATFGAKEPSRKPPATAAELSSNQITGKRVEITAVPRENGIICGKVFTDCDVVGPAIITPTDDKTAFIGVNFSAESADGLLWQFPARKKIFIGVIGIESCTFVNCRIQDIGIAGRKETIASFKAHFGLK